MKIILTKDDGTVVEFVELVTPEVVSQEEVPAEVPVEEVKSEEAPVVASEEVTVE